MNLLSWKNIFPFLIIFSFNCEASYYREGKIAGGYEAKPHSNPYVVSLQSKFLWIRSRICMGSILSHRWQLSLRARRILGLGATILDHIITEHQILSAGHCVTDSLAKWLAMDAIVGAHDIERIAYSEIYSITDRIAHPMYRGNIGPYDIAMMKTSRNIIFSNKVQPISLPTSIPAFKSNDRLLITGWGATQLSGFNVVIPRKLQEVEVTYISFNECYQAVTPFLDQNELNPLKRKANICTGPISGGIAGCSGDSGGPLISFVPYLQEETTTASSFITTRVSTDRPSTTIASTISPMTTDIPTTTESIPSLTTNRPFSKTTGSITSPVTTSDIVSSTSDYSDLTYSISTKLISFISAKSTPAIPIKSGSSKTSKEAYKIPMMESTSHGSDYQDIQAMKVSMKAIIIGVLSWGAVPCGDVGAPTVYSNVSNFMDFINIYLKR